MSKDIAEIHSYPQRLKRILYRIKSSKELSKQDKEALVKFHEDLILEGLSLGRIIRHLHNLILISKWLGKDFNSATADDIKVVATKIEKDEHYSDWSKYGFKITIRKFYKWLKNSKEYPPEVSWMKVRIKENNLKLPEELLTEEDIKKMVEITKDPMERAFVSVLYESGCRIGEILTLRIKDVEPDDYGIRLTVIGKTGSRRVRIVFSAPYLQEWINKHPFFNDKNSWLWLNRAKKVLKYQSATKILQKLGEKAKINKPLNAHNFRHSRATFLANYLTEAQMREFFGWVKDSDMTSVYTHLSGRDVDKALLKTYGINIEENGKKESVLKPRICIRCKKANSATDKFCECGMPLNEDAIVEVMKRNFERKQADEILDKLIQDEEFKEMFIKKFKEVVKKRI
jgi:site-specific recombinase XerD